MSIKQEIPDGYIAAQLPESEICHTKIPYKVIITDWLWRNQHAEPIKTVIIPVTYQWQDGIIAAYCKRIKKSA